MVPSCIARFALGDDSHTVGVVGHGDPIRVWTLGCSTGQEAYSIAMSFVEAADKALNDALLDKARHGREEHRTGSLAGAAATVLCRGRRWVSSR
jgi:CheR methyltransferase, SAM binding domain